MYPLRMAATVLLSLLILTSNGSAAWMDISLVNPGAETGDLTGWVGPDFTAENLGGDAYDGAWSFSTTNPPLYATIYQQVDILPGTASNLNLSAYFRLSSESGTAPNYYSFERIGYDAETDQEYRYYLQASLYWDWYVGNTQVAGYSSGFGHVTDWLELAMNTELEWITTLWQQGRDEIDRIEVGVDIMYYAVDWQNQPGAWDIEEWRGWVDNEVPVLAIDGVSLQYEPVPAPCAFLLLGSGLLGTLAVRRSKRS